MWGRGKEGRILREATLVTSSLLAIPLIAWLAAGADADTLPSSTLTTGVAVVVLFVAGGVLALARPAVATALFLVAAVLSFLAGHDDGLDGLALYCVLGFLLAAMCGACSIRRMPSRLVDAGGRRRR